MFINKLHAKKLKRYTKNGTGDMCSSPVTDGGCCEDFNPGVIHAA